MIRLVASDLDGTLLNKENQISERTANAVKKLQQQGIRFLINTEREYHDALHLLHPVQIDCDMICSGGAFIYDQSKKIYKASTIPLPQVRDALLVFGKYRTFYEICSTHGRCVLGSRTAYESYVTGEVIPSILMEDKDFSMTQIQFNQWMDQIHFYDNADILFLENPEILKITSSSNDIGKIRNLKHELQRRFPNIVVSGTSAYNIEITDIESQKGVALMEYARLHNFSLSEILVIGDSDVDYSMLALPYAHTVAMGNAQQQIKDICTYETKSNNEDGVALILEDLLS